jgi:hypothetical protein
MCNQVFSLFSVPPPLSLLLSSRFNNKIRTKYSMVPTPFQMLLRIDGMLLWW